MLLKLRSRSPISPASRSGYPGRKITAREPICHDGCPADRTDDRSIQVPGEQDDEQDRSGKTGHRGGNRPLRHSI